MSFSEEFFHQRSFEVVWATFRVAEYVERQELKHGLENRALGYLLKKTPRALADLSEIVQLGFKIGDISRVNARVLLREIDNLRQSLREREADEQKILASQTKDDAPDIAEIFASHAPMLLADIIKTGARGKEQGQGREIEEDKQEKEFEIASRNSISEQEVEIENNGAEKKIDIKGKTQERPMEVSGKERGREFSGDLPESGKDASGVRQSSGKTDQMSSGKVPASPANNPASPAKFRQDDNLSIKERKGLILDLLKTRNLCHINDISNILPNVSRRTIRYDIQRMVDAGEIERLGTSGPNSFFRLIQRASS